MTPDTEAAAARLAEYADWLERPPQGVVGHLMTAMDIRDLLAERAEHLAHPAPAAVVGEVMDEAEGRATDVLTIRSCLNAAYDPGDPAEHYWIEEAFNALDRLAAPPVPPAVVPGWRPTLRLRKWWRERHAPDSIGIRFTRPLEEADTEDLDRAVAELVRSLASAPKPGEAK